MFDRIKSLTATALIAGLSFATPALTGDAPNADTVMATVDGTEITLGHMIALRNSLPQQFDQIPADILYTGILDQLVQQTLLMQSFKGDLSRQSILTLENERRGLIASSEIERIMGSPITDDDLQKAYEKLGYKDGDFPVSEKAASEILSLPMYPQLTQDQQMRVAEEIKEFL